MYPKRKIYFVAWIVHVLYLRRSKAFLSKYISKSRWGQEEALARLDSVGKNFLPLDSTCRWIQLDSEYHPLALQYLPILLVKINTQMGSNPFVFSVSTIILAAIALEIWKLVQNGISSSLLVKSSAQTGSQVAATAFPPGGCLVCPLVDGTLYQPWKIKIHLVSFCVQP